MAAPTPTTDRWRVPLADILVDDEIRAAAADVVESGWWSMGPRVIEFEEAFARFCGAEHALAVSNGTAALHLALLACGVGPGDEVIVPSLTFVAAANTVVCCGATPVFCDITSDHDLNLDPADVERALSPRTKAIVVLHYGGFPCRIDAISELAAAAKVTVIEDAAHAPGASIDGRMCGTLSAAGCFSFFSNKNLPVGEGGIVVTGDPEVARQVRLLRSHGMTTLTWDRHRGHAASYDVLTPGFNFRLDEMRAAIGLVQLERLQAGNERRERAWLRYRDLLAAVEGVQLAFDATSDTLRSSYHIAVVVLPHGSARDEIQAHLGERGVQTSVHYPPIHRFTAYADGARRDLPVTEAVAERLLTLPLFPHIADEQIDLVVDALAEALAQPRRNGGGKTQRS